MLGRKSRLRGKERRAFVVSRAPKAHLCVAVPLCEWWVFID
jgi:hypothetical protein